MSDSAWSQPRVYLVLAGLVLLATARSLGNGFAFDDLPIILNNARVHAASPPWVYAQQSYWPPPGAAYRPWTIWMFALQWQAGNGAPWIFHTVNVLLVLAVTFTLYRFAVRLLPGMAAVLATALFAVHPVHVEATGNVVGQAELWMTLFVLLACLIYLDARRAGSPGPGTRWALAGLLVLAAASKEQGIVLPGLLLLLELLAVAPSAGKRRIATVAPTFVVLAFAAFVFFLGRFLVLGGLGGGPAIARLDTLSIVERIGAMSPIILTWVRLLVWPRHLEAQYSPPAYGLPPESALPVVAGLSVLGVLTIIAISARRTAPVVTLGLAWVGAALLPVANVLFPTGIVVAERTLFLPSVGAVLAGVAGAVWAIDRVPRLTPVLVAGALLLTAAGTARSYSRQAVWHDNLTLFAQTIIDGPRSYRGFQVYAREFEHRGRPELAAAMFERAADLYQGDPRVFEDWGQIHRAAANCETAATIFARGLADSPEATVLRSRLFECLMTMGQYPAALETAEQGIALGMDEFAGAAIRARMRITP